MTARRRYLPFEDTYAMDEPARKPLRGLDYQGRHPVAAEACTELGADDYDDLGPSKGIVIALSLVAAISATVLALHYLLT